MIFAAKNEKGEPTWKLALEEKKDITRRLEPLPVGKEFAIQPGRGKFAVCRAVVVSCIKHEEWVNTFWNNSTYKELLKELEKEAKREGFTKWINVYKYFYDRKIYLKDLFRVEFKLVKGGKKDDN